MALNRMVRYGNGAIPNWRQASYLVPVQVRRTQWWASAKQNLWWWLWRESKRNQFGRRDLVHWSTADAAAQPQAPVGRSEGDCGVQLLHSVAQDRWHPGFTMGLNKLGRIGKRHCAHGGWDWHIDFGPVVGLTNVKCDRCDGWRKTLDGAGCKWQCLAWGDDAHGQLGRGATLSKYCSECGRWSEQHRPGLRVRRGIQPSRGSSGNIWAWGNNYHGQLGDGTSTNTVSPVRAHKHPRMFRPVCRWCIHIDGAEARRVRSGGLGQ